MDVFPNHALQDKQTIARWPEAIEEIIQLNTHQKQIYENRELSLSSPAYHMFSWKGEAKEQDISAGPGSRKQRKQGNESFKNQLQFSNH